MSSIDTQSPQRLDEWRKLDESALAYHRRQWDEPKRSTIAFAQSAECYLRESRRVVDLGAGAGAATAFIASQYSLVSFTAVDYSSDLVTLGSRLAYERKIANLEFEQADWFDLRLSGPFDGCVSLQTLSWLPEFRRPLREIFRRVRPKWVGVSSLFYPGDITCHIEIEEHKRDRKSFYNVYSIPEVSRFCLTEGYRLTRAEPFVIDIDLEKPQDVDFMGTFTRRLSGPSGADIREQFSGPLLMPWYFVFLERC